MLSIVLAKAQCCTEYVVALGYRLGRCGLCRQQPTIEPDQLFEQIEISLAPLDERETANGD
jgi:hypothetical protein